MFEFLEFSSVVYMLGFELIRISRYQDKWKVEHEKGMPESEKRMAIFDNLDDWIERFEALNVDDWKEEYLNPMILDGNTWILKYDYANKTQREIHGTNDYPKNYKAFTKLLDELIEQI